MEDVVGNNPALSDQKHSTIMRFSLQSTVSDIYIKQILGKDSSINQILGRQGEGLSITPTIIPEYFKNLDFSRSITP